MERQTKTNLSKDIEEIRKLAYKQGYIFNASDAFALGYLAGKHGLDKFVNNEEQVLKLCALYDETDDLGLNDTISETLADLKIITRHVGNEDYIK